MCVCVCVCVCALCVCVCVCRVMWGVDDNGHLIVTETRRADPTRVAAAQQASAAAPQPTYPAVNGKARIPLAGNVLMEVGHTHTRAHTHTHTHARTLCVVVLHNMGRHTGG